MEKICFGIHGLREYYLLVIYDVFDNKRRTKLAKLMEGYGHRVQMSAFECNLNTKQYNSLLRDIDRVIHKEDNIRIYNLAKRKKYSDHPEDSEVLSSDLYIA